MIFHLISAAPMEVEPLLIQLKRENIGYLYHPLGIGCLEAAKNAPAIVQRLRQTADPILYLGTCGVFSSFGRPKIFAPVRVHWLPTCERLGVSHRIKGTDAPIDLQNSTPELNAIEATVLSCPNISLSETLALKSVEPKKIFVENLELYSFLMSAQALKSSMQIYLASTNKVGQSAHEEWLQNHDHAHRVLAEFIFNNIKHFSP